MKPLFTRSYVQDVYEDFVNENINKEIQSLTYLGERFVIKARNTGNYTDRTGNLRSSIGYVILQNGRKIQSNINKADSGNDGDQGLKTANQFTKNLTKDFPTGLVLVVFAGMEYAAAVESKGYDVLTGSAPTDSEVASILRILKKVA